jgi:hypothetical protein
MMGRSRIERTKSNAASAANYAVQLARDDKFRRLVLSAIEHGAEAGRRTRRSLGLAGALTRLATDQALLKELQGARRDLMQARERLERKRRSHKLRRLIVLASLAALAAIPQVRERFIAAIRDAARRLRSQKDSTHSGDNAVPAGRRLEDLTREELYARAQEVDLPGRSEMSKDQLVEALRSLN